MTADLLTRAAQSITERAAEMRAAFPGYDDEPKFLEAVAAWLRLTEDRAAVLGYRGEGQPGSPHAAALATARAWLGEDS